jgi:hypothetical protein
MSLVATLEQPIRRDSAFAILPDTLNKNECQKRWSSGGTLSDIVLGKVRGYAPWIGIVNSFSSARLLLLQVQLTGRTNSTFDGDLRVLRLSLLLWACWTAISEHTH